MAGRKRYGMTPDGRMTECHAKNPDTCPYHTQGSHKELTQREVDRVNEATGRKRYGMTPDGRMTECHAKNPDTCPYHTQGSHKELTQREVDRVNEATARAAQISKSAPGLRKTANESTTGRVKTKNEYLKLIDDLALKSNDVYNGANLAMMKMEADFRNPVTDVNEVLPSTVENKPEGMSDLALKSNDVYNGANLAMMKMEADFRNPVTDVNEVLPSTVENKPEGMSPTEWTADVSNKELAYLMDSNTKDLTGRTLLAGESRMIGDELVSYAKRQGVDRRANGGFSNEPTPAEERALKTLMDNPLADEDDTVKDLVNNADVMGFGARYAINSPYLSDTTKTQAFNTSPENAIESQSLDGRSGEQRRRDGIWS